MLQWKNSTVIAIVLFFTLMSIVLWTKPAFLYDREKKAFKPFSTGNNGTIFPLWIVAIFFGVVSYALTVWILRTTATSDKMGGLGGHPPLYNNHIPSMASMPMNMPVPMPMSMQVPVQVPMQMPMQMPSIQVPMSMYSMATTPPPPTTTSPNVMAGGGGGGGNGNGGSHDLYDISRSRVWRNF